MQATYGERFRKVNKFGVSTEKVVKGSAWLKKATSAKPEDYPTGWKYVEDVREIRLLSGDSVVGIVEKVSPEVASFAVSGMGVVKSWLGYRMKVPAGKKSSPLDYIQAERWEFDRDLLNLLWVVEYVVNAEPVAAGLLGRVMDGGVFTAEELPEPEGWETREPKRPVGPSLLDEAAKTSAS